MTFIHLLWRLWYAFGPVLVLFIIVWFFSREEGNSFTPPAFNPPDNDVFEVGNKVVITNHSVIPDGTTGTLYSDFVGGFAEVILPDESIKIVSLNNINHA